MSKQMLKMLSVATMLLLCSTVATAKQDLTVAVDKDMVGGSIVASIADNSREVTLTVTPAAGYAISRSDIVVRPMVAPGVSGSRRRVPIAVPLQLTGDDPADLSAERKYTFTVPEAYSGAYVTATFHTGVTIVMGDNALRTYSAPYDLDFSGVDGLEAYIANAYTPTGDGGGRMVMLRVTSVPAGTGLLLRGTAGATYTVRQAPSATYVVNLLVGAPYGVELSPTDGTYTNYVLAVKNGVTAFYPLSESGQLGAGLAYLQLPTGVVGGSRAIGLHLDDDATGVAAAGARPSAAPWYDLQGRRYDSRPVAKGVYIYKGKKVKM
jgi:hypothetical protein